MLRFENVDALYLLFFLPLLVLLFVLFDKQRAKKLKKIGNEEIIQKLTVGLSLSKRWKKRVYELSALAFLIIALANPQIGAKMEEVKREGIDILVALDVSKSMLAEDIAPNRLKKAKHEIREFIDGLRGDRIGLIPFAGTAFTQCPLTLDYSTAEMFLDLMDIYTIPRPGTSIGSAIESAINSFPEKDRKYKVLVLITDGEDHESDIEQISAEAKEHGIVIYTIGIGALEGAPIPEFDKFGNKIGFKKDYDGNIVTTKLDVETLRKISSKTGGKFFHVSPEQSELDVIFSEISRMEKKELGSKEFTTFDDQFQWFLGIALLFLILNFFTDERELKKKTWQGRFN
jgi:Ca-activated chloride channel family protein